MAVRYKRWQQHNVCTKPAAIIKIYIYTFSYKKINCWKCIRLRGCIRRSHRRIQNNRFVLHFYYIYTSVFSQRPLYNGSLFLPSSSSFSSPSLTLFSFSANSGGPPFAFSRSCRIPIVRRLFCILLVVFVVDSVCWRRLRAYSSKTA